MQTYELKEKIQVTEKFLQELEIKCWQEIESLQTQIANIENNKNNIGIIQLLKNLLTSYYVFIGGLENLKEESNLEMANIVPKEVIQVDDIKTKLSTSDDLESAEPDIKVFNISTSEEIEDNFEPFEYFVDFDEPVGSPLTDKDLYS